MDATNQNECVVDNSRITEAGDGRTYIVTELCPHCENEIEMRWNTDERGFKAFCPVCGGRLMLCDECRHTPDGERSSRCDYDRMADTCHRSKANGIEVEEKPTMWDKAAEQPAGCGKRVALEAIDRLHRENRLSSADYDTLFDTLSEMETLRDRDAVLEELWAQFGDVPMDPKTECIEAPFLGWGPGVNREEIWHWFDRRHSKGVGYLLYRSGIDRADQLAKMVYLKQLCIECESAACQFNHGGECRFAMVHERKPRINDVDGCIDYDYQEGD